MTISRPASRTLRLILAALAVATTCTVAVAQSPNELRRENQRLRAELEAMNLELQAARATLEAVRAERDLLRVRLSNLPVQTPPIAPSAPGGASAPPPVIDASRPESSPPALLMALSGSYAEVTADLEMGAEDRDPQRVVYLRRVDRWVRRVNREFKSPIEWHVVVVDPTEPFGRDLTMQLAAIDPASERSIGDPFKIQLSRPLHSRLGHLDERGKLGGVLILKGVLNPKVRFNRAREVVGTFDNPPFIGPFAEFEFSVSPTSLVPRPEKKPDGKPKRAASEPDHGVDTGR